VNASDDSKCAYQEADTSPPDQLGLFLGPDGTDISGWAVSPCATDPYPHDELDDGADTHDYDATCRQGSTNGNRVGVTFQNPALTDPADVDDFTVVTSAVVNKQGGQGASVSIDVKVGSSGYNNGATQSTTASYTRYSRTNTQNPINNTEWNTGDVQNLVGAVRCVDCNPNNRVTQMQAKVDAFYNAEYALEVRFGFAGIPLDAESWILVLECTRLNGTTPESVLVQVGQGGALPLSWRTVFTCDSDSDKASPSIPLSLGEVNGGAPAVRLWDA
jgi:hypothetical protein